MTEVSTVTSKTRTEINKNLERIHECERKTLERIIRCEELINRKADRNFVEEEVRSAKEQFQK